MSIDNYLTDAIIWICVYMYVELKYFNLHISLKTNMYSYIILCFKIIMLELVQFINYVLNSNLFVTITHMWVCVFVYVWWVYEILLVPLWWIIILIPKHTSKANYIDCTYFANISSIILQCYLN